MPGVCKKNRGRSGRVKKKQSEGGFLINGVFQDHAEWGRKSIMEKKQSKRDLLVSSETFDP